VIHSRVLLFIFEGGKFLPPFNFIFIQFYRILPLGTNRACDIGQQATVTW